MAVNGAISKTTFTETTVSYTSKIRPVHITELRTAIDRLQSYAANVDNCGNCTYCQTCQSATCQSAVCQSQSCQSLSCQSCQSLVVSPCNVIVTAVMMGGEVLKWLIQIQP